MSLENQKYCEDEIDLFELFEKLWKRKKNNILNNAFRNFNSYIGSFYNSKAVHFWVFNSSSKY